MKSRLVVDVQKLFRLHAEGKTAQEICNALGISNGSWHAVRTRYGLPPTKPARKPRDEYMVDPTPDEIAERAAEVRSRWSPSERRKRKYGGRQQTVAGNYRFSRTDFVLSPAAHPW